MVSSGKRTFSEYAAAKGCKILKDDFVFLRNKLGNLPASEKNQVLKCYIDVWVKEMSECTSEIRKQNQGRFAANTWIRTR